MFTRKKGPLTPKQKKTYGYLRVIVGVYLVYTAYCMYQDLKAGIEADNPTLVIVMAVLFAIVGSIFAVTGFMKAFKVTEEELKAVNEEENVEIVKNEEK
ncbi:MAG: hypothetical protein ACI4FV_10650 [Lachnospiraceae bacterium]